MIDQPVRNTQELSLAFQVTALSIEIEIAQPILRDRDRIMLPTNHAAIIEQRNSIAIERPRIVGLGREGHVVLAQYARGRISIHFRSLMPKSQLAGTAAEVSLADSM